MKTRNTLATLIGAAVLAVAVALPKIVHADGLSIHDHDGNVSVDLHAGDGHDDHHRHHIHHEEMDLAISSLREARRHLDKGGHDFGGHRMEAIHAADKAIHEIQAAIDFAESHDH
jgi:hypothetical protein